MFNMQFNVGASRDAIRRAVAQLTDTTPMFGSIANYMLRVTQQRFVRGEAPDGSKWAPKRQSTLERYKRLGRGNRTQPLKYSGALSADIIRTHDRSSAVIGSALIYSGVMQNGAAKGAFGRDRHGRPLPWGNIPARVWLGISADDGVAIVDIADEYLADALGPDA